MKEKKHKKRMKRNKTTTKEYNQEDLTIMKNQKIRWIKSAHSGQKEFVDLVQNATMLTQKYAL